MLEYLKSKTGDGSHFFAPRANLKHLIVINSRLVVSVEVSHLGKINRFRLRTMDHSSCVTQQGTHVWENRDWWPKVRYMREKKSEPKNSRLRRIDGGLLFQTQQRRPTGAINANQNHCIEERQRGRPNRPQAASGRPRSRSFVVLHPALMRILVRVQYVVDLLIPDRTTWTAVWSPHLGVG